MEMKAEEKENLKIHGKVKMLKEKLKLEQKKNSRSIEIIGNQIKES